MPANDTNMRDSTSTNDRFLMSTNKRLILGLGLIDSATALPSLLDVERGADDVGS
jgi:hypothetical protein